MQPHVAPAQPTLFSEESVSPSKPEQRRSLNDVLMEQKEDNSIASSFQNKRVQDLAKSININDKFLFIKELFRGKGEEFGMAIQKLNRCDSLEEAFNEIDSMNPNWQTEESIQQSYVIQIQEDICVVDYYLHPIIPTLIVHGLR